ncbi:MAG: hypothetical protein M1829_003876 [Trizodia sp. TS-e1964]|nr:MAG: hypothetical protein M1829_003876 [Trizodia sp. TS-e1964]
MQISNGSSAAAQVAARAAILKEHGALSVTNSFWLLASFPGTAASPGAGFYLFPIDMADLKSSSAPLTHDRDGLLYRQTAGDAGAGVLKMALDVGVEPDHPTRTDLGHMRAEGYLRDPYALGRIMGANGRAQGTVKSLRDVFMGKVRNMKYFQKL